MNTQIKLLAWLFLVSSFFIFTSCEKDLYDEAIQEPKNILGKVNYVTIEDVPFLIPSIQEYKRNSKNLSNSNNSYRGIEDLDLDLNHIIEYLETNGFKSYSIAIKKEFEADEDIYFQNLHIIKVDGIFQPFIAKYNSTDDLKEFKAESFTGKIEIFTVNDEFAGLIEMQNGFKLADPAPATPDEQIGGGGGGDPPSWMPTWLAELLGYWNGNPHSSGSSSSSSSGTGGVFIIFNNSGGPVMGNPPTVPVQNTTTGNTVVVPNEPQWIYPTTQHMMENRIEKRLSLNINSVGDAELIDWIENPANDEVIEEIYLFLFEEENNENIRNFTRLALDALKNGGEVDLGNRIIYTINKPCQKQIVKDVMAISSQFTNLIKDTFDCTDLVNVKFSNGNVPSGNPAYTNPIIYGNPENYTISIMFDNNYLDNATDLSIIAVALHELVHAYLIHLYLSGTLVATNSNFNTLQNAFITFYDNMVQDTFEPLDNEIHNAMRDFMDKIANSIYNYANLNNIPNVSPQYCVDLAWGTMTGTDLFNTVLNSDQQLISNNTAAYEQDNLPQAKGTPCN